jgi:hypothetical protein
MNFQQILEKATWEKFEMNEIQFRELPRKAYVRRYWKIIKIKNNFMKLS